MSLSASTIERGFADGALLKACLPRAGAQVVRRYHVQHSRGHWGRASAHERWACYPGREVNRWRALIPSPLTWPASQRT